MTQVQEGYVKAYNIPNKLYYKSMGSGDITLLATNGVGVNTMFWKYVQEFMSQKYRFVVMDYIGHGKSEDPDDLEHMTIENMARDANVVLEELNVDKAVILGHSMGAQVIFEFYRLFPEKVIGLVPTLGAFGHPAFSFFNTEFSIYGYYLALFFVNNFPEFTNKFMHNIVKPEIMREIIIWLGGRIGLINPYLMPKNEMKKYLDHVERLDMKVFIKLFQSMQEHTAEDILPSIKAPVFIIAGDNDVYTPLWVSEEMKRIIPKSQLLVVRGGSHGALIEQPTLINCWLEKFVDTKVKNYLRQTKKNKKK